jgi:hypothetical protein
MCWHPLARKLQQRNKMSEIPENFDEAADSGLPSHDLFSVAGDTPETDQLLACDQYKIDEDAVEYSAYRRMVEHAQALERRLNVTPSEKTDCARLLEEAEYEIFDVVDDGMPVVIELHPRNGSQSMLLWRPMNDGGDEVQLWVYEADAVSPEIRNISLIGKPARVLREFISSENANVDARIPAPSKPESITD